MSLTENTEIKRLLLYAYLEPKASKLALSKLDLCGTISCILCNLGTIQGEISEMPIRYAGTLVLAATKLIQRTVYLTLNDIKDLLAFFTVDLAILFSESPHSKE